MSSLSLYRTLVPEHAAVVDDTITTYLELAVRRHSSAVFGAVYPEAMVWWAAHRIERTPGLVPGAGGAGEVGAVVSQRDGDLSRTYAQPKSDAAPGTDTELATTKYGQAYLELRDSRAGVAPTVVPAW